MKNNNIKIFNPHHKKNILRNDEVFCKQYCNDSLLQLLNFSYKEIIILKLRWNDFRPFKDIAYELSLSQERVRAIYRKNIKKIILLINSKGERNNFIEVSEEEVISHIESDNQFKTKWVNILKEKNILTFQQLANYDREQLSHIKSFGKNTLDAIELILRQHGYEFAKQV